MAIRREKIQPQGIHVSMVDGKARYTQVVTVSGTGKMIFLRTGRPGTVQTLAGVPPLDVQIDNAAGVALTFRGQPVNLAPYTRANIARLLLK